MKIYIHPHVINQRFSFRKLVEEIVYLCKSIAPRDRVIPVIENVAAQKWLYDELRKLGIRAELFEIHGIEKSERLKISALAVEAGMVFFPNHCRGIEELKTQLIGFGSERFNDLADAFAITVNIITENRNGGFSFVRAEDGRSFEEFKRGISPTPKTDLPWKNDAELRELEKKLDLEIHNKQVEEASRPGINEERTYLTT